MDGIVVLISGRGSNLRAICNSGLAASIKCVISNKADAAGLQIALEYQIPIHIIEHKNFPTRELFDQALLGCISKYDPKIVVLSGFMRILTKKFVTFYKNRLINIHPSLLPAFIGSDAQKDAIKSHVKVSGATVHFVTQELDHGPIIAQGVVQVMVDDSREILSERILKMEHIIYPFAINKILANEVQITNSGLVIVSKNFSDQLLLGDFQNHIYY